MLPRVRPGDKVDGRSARGRISNKASIGAELNQYRTHGVREVPMNMFPVAREPYTPSRRTGERVHTEALTAAIKRNQRVSPLIVVFDDKGPYVLEGGHRFDALHSMGAKSFPALVVTEPGYSKWSGWEHPRHPAGTPGGKGGEFRPK